MKGVVFNILEDFITEGWGVDAYERILANSRLRTRDPFVGPGTYPDEDLLAIVAQASAELGVEPNDAVHAFGKYMFPKLATKFPVFVENHRHPKTFLQTIDSVIHVEVAKLFRDAEPPSIVATVPAPDRMILTYVSRRKLCTLMAGLLEGTAEWFRTPIRYAETRCSKKGGDACVFEVVFPDDHE